VELCAEIARIALDCPSCGDPIRQLIIQFKNQNQNENDDNINPVRGHSSLAKTNERNRGVSNVREYNTIQYK
jgi:hypothetical protein